MNLLSTYKELIGFGNNSNSSFLAKIIDDELDFRIAIDIAGNPILLLNEKIFTDNDLAKNNYRLNYLEIMFNQKCTINDLHDQKSREMIFTTIKLNNGNFRMIDYFLILVKALVYQLKRDLSFKSLNNEIQHLIDLFSYQKPIGIDIVLGLWGELFYIYQNDSVAESVKAWHDDKTNSFDFCYDSKKYFEIKTTTKNKREHNFSLNQIKNYQTFDLEICSIITESSSFGYSIKDLWDSILPNLRDIDLESKLTKIISQTLNNDFQSLYDYKFSVDLAKSSIEFYNTKDVPKINEMLHPSITDIKLKIDLDKI